jgi:hypothetical protein
MHAPIRKELHNMPWTTSEVVTDWIRLGGNIRDLDRLGQNV